MWSLVPLLDFLDRISMATTPLHQRVVEDVFRETSGRMEVQADRSEAVSGGDKVSGAEAPRFTL